ncbi:uncharacterized protein [Eurosta solidaginis]
MKQTRKEKCSSQKLTRWDRIRKRNVSRSSFMVKSDVVKHFVEKNYISHYDESVLHGERKLNRILNPAMVMDMRHELFRKLSPKLPIATVRAQRIVEACVSHNLVVEDRYLQSELNKFRQQLQKNFKRNTLTIKFIEKTEHHTYNIDNNYLINSLERNAKHIENFYTAPINALRSVENLFESTHKRYFREDKGLCAEKNGIHKQEENSNNSDFEKDKYIDEECIAESTNRLEGIYVKQDVVRYSHMVVYELQAGEREMTNLTSNKPEAISDKMKVMETNNEHLRQIRAVRFQDPAEIRSFSRDTSACSNFSTGNDSVVSGLAEGALQAEAQSPEVMDFQLLPEKSSGPNEFGIYLAGATSPKKRDDTFEPLVITKLTKTKREDPVPLSDDIEEECVPSHELSNTLIEQPNSRANTNQTFLRKYFLKWTHFVTIEKIEREDVSSKGDRIHKINLFLEKVRKEKLHLIRQSRQCTHANTREDQSKKSTESTLATKKYQNKIKIQQDVIDLQRLKLERQERIIMELKLNKLSEQAKEVRLDLKNDLNSMIQHGDPKIKAKAKCLLLIGNLREEKKENLASLQGKAMILPQFLRDMQERALERSVRHEKARQRRLQQEAEKEAHKMAAEEAKRLEDEKTKRLRIEALKEKRRQEKMAKILKEREHQRAIESKSKADEFYRRLLLSRVGMGGFKNLVVRKRENEQKCEELRRKIFKRTYFSSWRNYYLKIQNEKLKLAHELYKKIYKRKTLWAWQHYVQEERSKFHVAADWCDLKIIEAAFKFWAQYTKRLKAIESRELNQARSHHE